MLAIQKDPVLPTLQDKRSAPAMPLQKDLWEYDCFGVADSNQLDDSCSPWFAHFQGSIEQANEITAITISAAVSLD